MSSDDSSADLDRLNSNRSEADSTTISGGGCNGGCGDGGFVREIGAAKGAASKSSVPAGPQTASFEFMEWLERSLDGYGLEPSLYSRCVLSIMSQPPEPAPDVGRYQSETATTKYTPFVHSNQIGRNNISAPSSRKNSFGSLVFASAIAPVTAVQEEDDARKQALLDCLKTMNDDKMEVEKFVDEIVIRYSSICKQGVFGEKQNDSVDSGVCPSPEESFQNYDEAFPPLAQENTLNDAGFDVFLNEALNARPRGKCPSWLNGKRPAEGSDKAEVLFVPAAPNDNADRWVDSDIISGACGDSSPVKRQKLNAGAECEHSTRSLRSCPDFVLSSGIAAGAAVCAEKRATFCCPVVKKQQPRRSAAVNCNQPQFVIPKCWTVGSWPSRYHRSTKPVGDVPFWSCSEWFCTIHKRLEFGLLNAKISGDTNTLARQPFADLCKNGWASQNDPTELNTTVEEGTPDANSYMDVDIFELDHVLPIVPQQVQQPSWPYGRPASQQQPTIELPTRVLPDMFDAPRFILHIINEDDGILARENNLSSQNENIGYTTLDKNEVQPPCAFDWSSLNISSGDDALVATLQRERIAQSGYDAGLNWPSAAAYSKFSFDAIDGEDATVLPGTEMIFPVDISGLTANTDIGFCLPKFGRFPSVNQQQLVAPTATSVGPIGEVPENQALRSDELFGQGHPKKLPQSMAVPIKDSTHFIPIRSESMEDAYYLKPGFDEFGAAIEHMEDYYIYHQDDSIGVAAASDASAVKDKVFGGRQRRSLAPKFRAANPDKMCQTEEQGSLLKSGGSSGAAVAALFEGGHYDQEFEIWSYQPVESKSAVVFSRWNEEASEKMENACEGFSPTFDDGWFSELVSSGSKTPDQLASAGDQYSRAMGDGIGGGGNSEQATSIDGQQQLDIWQKEDERYEDSLLRYVSSISLISPLDVQSTTV